MEKSKNFKVFYKKYVRYLNVALLSMSAVFLIGFENETIGWILLVLATASLLFTGKEYAKNVGLLHISIAALGIAPIGTSTSQPFALYMGTGLLVAVAFPYITTKFVYKNNFISFPVLHERAWGKKRLAYLLLTLTIGWLLIPLMLRSNDSYLNWSLEPGFWNLFESYLGLNAVGIWDELFFILTALAILYKFFPFYIANAVQAIFFTAFLFAVGFEGWSFLIIYPFALLQGYIFKKTKSLLFILAIHLTIDLVLHLALVYLHFPHLFPYFVT